MFSIIYLHIVYLTYAISKRNTISKYHFFTSLSGASGACTCEIDVVPLTSIYAFLKSHKLDLNIEVLNSI